MWLRNGREGEAERSHPVESSRTEDAPAMRNRLIWVAGAPTWGLMMSRPGLLLRAVSESVALPQLGSVWTSMTHVTTEEHTDTCGLGPHLRPC